MLYFDWTFWLVVPAAIFAFWAQAKVRSAFTRYSRVPSARGLTGAEVAQDLLRRAEIATQTERAGGTRAAAALGAVSVEMAPGELSDHYDPSANALRLSEPVYGSSSIAAVGVAAHETGHAIQHATGYAGVALRATLLPMARFGSTLAMPLFLIGLIFSAGQGSGLRILRDIGILLYVAALLFTLITLPVEYDASRRALALLEEGGYVSRDELQDVKRVLGAAALTYVAAAAVAVMTLIRLLILRSERD
jgi:Zn-dependent membrane protease YugP